MSEMSGPTAEQLNARDFGERLAKSLKVCGLSVTEMAAWLEVNRNTVGAWISGRQHPHPAMLKLWSIKTNVPVAWLRDGNYPEHPENLLTQVSQHQ